MKNIVENFQKGYSLKIYGETFKNIIISGLRTHIHTHR